MAATISDPFELLGRATCPADVFGALAADPQATLRRRYRALAAAVHPDHNADRRGEATEAFCALRHWYSVAQEQLRRGTYAAAPRISAVSRLHTYTGHVPPL